MSSPSHPRRRSPAFMPLGIKAILCVPPSSITVKERKALLEGPLAVWMASSGGP
jgi:hypothetical protein